MVYGSTNSIPHRPLHEDSDSSLPPTKLPKDTPTTPTPVTSPPSLSPEQKHRITLNKIEAESKLIAKKFGAEKIGSSWTSALSSEFKKPYITSVSV